MAKTNKSHLIIKAIVIISVFIVFVGKFISPIEINMLLWVYSLLITLIIFITFSVAYTYYKDPAERVILKKKPLVSVLIAVKNEEKLIESCVMSFVNQKYKNKEVIIIDDGSSDDTPAILDRLHVTHGIKVIHLEKNIGKKKALCLGMQKSKGDIFVFSDSDSIAEEDAVVQLVKVFCADKTTGAVTGHGRALNGGKNILTRIQDVWYDGQFRVVKGMESVFGAVTCCSGCLSAFRREAIYPFIEQWANDKFLGKEFKGATDRQLTGYVLGAPYYYNRAARFDDTDDRKMTSYALIDWKVKYCASAKVLTEVPDNFKTFIRQQIRWKKNFIRNLFFTGAIYWKKHPLASFVWYSGALFTFISPFIAFYSLVLMPLGGDIWTPLIYLSGIIYIGFIYGIDHKLAHPESTRWVYRPLMSLISTFILSWLLFYAILTIRSYTWLTR